MQQDVNSELAIYDLQRRLSLLGYTLGDEAEQGLFGAKTAFAVATFKEAVGLGSDGVLDQTTWAALRDASMQMGDRLLYLHMPHFRGRDVAELQGALSSMGFSCILDNSFGPETEQALRDFQENMELEPTGILDKDSLEGILRFRHIWEGKHGFSIDGRPLLTARPLQVLETNPVCIFGTEETTRTIASRVANLARATTADSKLVGVSSLEAGPSEDMLLIGVEWQGETERESIAHKESAIPVVRILPGESFEEELRQALQIARRSQNRLTLIIDGWVASSDVSQMEYQRIALRILDTLCRVLLPS